jgi:hypothetical protein
MTKLLLLATAFGLAVSGANACESERSASSKVDKMTVASTAQSVATPELAAPADRRVKDDRVEQEG